MAATSPSLAKISNLPFDIEIYANDRAGLLSDIIKEVGNNKCKLIAVNSKANKEIQRQLIGRRHRGEGAESHPGETLAVTAIFILYLIVF